MTFDDGKGSLYRCVVRGIRAGNFAVFLKHVMVYQIWRDRRAKVNSTLFAAVVSPLLVAGPVSESSAATICTNNAMVGRICAGETLSTPPAQVRLDASLALAGYLEPTAARAASWQVVAEAGGTDGGTSGGDSGGKM